MRSFSWVFRPKRIYLYNFESSDTRNIGVIVVMPGKKGSNIDSKTVYDILIKMRMLVTDSIL